MSKHLPTAVDSGNTMINSSRSSRSELCALETALKDTNQTFSQRYNSVRTFLDSLAKPVGSLGSLEDYGARIAALQRTSRPNVDNPICIIFAADHGVAKDKSDGGVNCSAYPQAVSRKVLEGLDKGMAGASVLARQNKVRVRVIDMGLADGLTQYEWSNEIVRSSESRVMGGTQNFCIDNAMSIDEVEQCILAGRKETGSFIDEANGSILIFGEVGIGNTTTSAALIAALTGIDITTLCGTGASTTRDGIDDAVIEKKVSIIKQALEHHKDSSLEGEPLKALQAVGGAEIAAIVGGMLESSKRDIPILVDGFIVTTAAMIACQMDASVSRVLIFATQSTEKGQAVALDVIKDVAQSNDIPIPSMPALNMNLRMGEATGALLAVPLVQSSCAVVAELATLNEVLSIEM